MPTDREIILFHRAVQAGKELTLKRRIARGMPPDATSEGFMTALALAALKGLPGCAEVLLRAGADPNAGASSSKPLVLAGRGGSVEVIRQLLQCGADLQRDGIACAAQALRHGQPHVVLALLDEGLPVNDHHEGQSLLDLVLEHRQTWSLVPALLARGADPRGRGERDRPLVLAASEGDLALMAQLVAAGADVNQPGPNATPLEAAAREGHVDAGAWLLDHGAALGTALHVARELPFVELLLARGASASAVDADGRSALTLARREGRAAIADRLRAAGALDQPEYEAEIEASRAQASAQLDVNSTSLRGFRERHPDARAGKAVDGPFSGMAGTGVLLPSGQVRALLEIFGRLVEITLEAAQFQFELTG